MTQRPYVWLTAIVLLFVLTVSACGKKAEPPPKPVEAPRKVKPAPIGYGSSKPLPNVRLDEPRNRGWSWRASAGR